MEDAFAEASRRVREGVALEDKDDGDDGSATRRVDYLAPFLVDVPDPYNMDEQTALKVQMKCLFEVQDLAVASPATVSRLGVMYMAPKDLGWYAPFKTWLETMLLFNYLFT